MDAALEAKPSGGRVVDLGTGSGALFVTALLELPSAHGIAVDASHGALQVAQDNAQRHGLGRMQARHALCDWRGDGWGAGLGTFDLVLCNPPYVEEDAELDPDVRNYEPATALFAGKDGLDDYRTLIPQMRKLMNDSAVAIFETGASQADSVREIAEQAGFSVEIRNDLANRPRCAILR
ncbi:peptide chain release factor N(5)-glutamine methyltransferase [Erythrobacter sp. JK5]|uniref:peptide chain release factor N(5)-glutamine methyltransferase n=1 Tax=Erythrobacter sp. JK5 TaxID=2829500 RepID=UPI0035301714